MRFNSNLRKHFSLHIVWCSRSKRSEWAIGAGTACFELQGRNFLKFLKECALLFDYSLLPFGDSLTTRKYLHVDLFHNASTLEEKCDMFGSTCRQTVAEW